MSKPTLLFITLFASLFLYSQEAFLQFKKGYRSIEKFWKGSFISFQLENKVWEKGEIMKISSDSFYIRPRVVKYSLMRTDTFYYPVKGFKVSDVYAMPKRGVLIDFIDGKFQISRTGGHQHFYWIKSGFIFKVGGAGFAILSIVNGSPGTAIIGGIVFLGGVALKKLYKLTIRVKGKYRMEIFKLSG